MAGGLGGGAYATPHVDLWCDRPGRAAGLAILGTHEFRPPQSAAPEVAHLGLLNFGAASNSLAALRARACGATVGAKGRTSCSTCGVRRPGPGLHGVDRGRPLLSRQ